MRLGSKEIPKTLEPILVQIRDRVKELTEQYGSLSRWGRPYFFSIDEVATIVWLNDKLNVSLDRIAKFIGVDKTSLYKVMKRIDQGKVTYYDQKEGKVIVKMTNKEELISIIEERLTGSTKQRITDPFKSVIVKEFFTNQVRKRAVRKGKGEYLTDKDKKDTLRVIEKIMKYIIEKTTYPSNPDMWTEDIVLDVLNRMVNDNIITPRMKRVYMKYLRRIPKWSQWFNGLIGAEVSWIEPVERVIFYKDYLRIKQLCKEGKITEQEWLVIALHISTGAREGFKLYPPKTDLDNKIVTSSLIGLRWENVVWRGEFEDDSIVIKIYESKTAKWWRSDPAWLDKDISIVLRKYAKQEGSIIKSITGIRYVKDFANWYRKLLKKISKLLELKFELKPHDMRRSSISIKAELGIPLELAVSDKMPLGVGWEDLKTAVVFYLRFSRHTIRRLYEQIQSAKKLFY